MNSKSEFMGESIPRLTIEVRDKVRQVDHNGVEMKPNNTKRGSTPGEQGGESKRSAKRARHPTPEVHTTTTKTQAPNIVSATVIKQKVMITEHLWGES